MFALVSVESHFSRRSGGRRSRRTPSERLYLFVIYSRNRRLSAPLGNNKRRTRCLDTVRSLYVAIITKIFNTPPPFGFIGALELNTRRVGLYRVINYARNRTPSFLQNGTPITTFNLRANYRPFYIQTFTKVSIEITRAADDNKIRNLILHSGNETKK